MNMSNEILKIKSDYEYVSQSENYIVFVSNTFINVYHVLTNKTHRFNKVHVKNVCIDANDNYLFLSMFESGCLSIYDLKEGAFLKKRTILRSYEIENISPINDDIVILLRNKKEKGKIKDFYEFENNLKELFLFDYVLCIYQIKTDKFTYIDLPTNIFLIEHPIEIKHQYIYPMQIINHNDLKTIYYILNQYNKLSLLKNDLLKYDLYSYDFNYFVRKEYKTFKIEDIEYKDLYKITLYDSFQNELFFIENNQDDFSATFEICEFTRAYDNKNILYFYMNSTIYLYEINKKLNSRQIDNTLISVYISLKNDYIVLRTSNRQCSMAYMYNLSRFFDL